MSGALAIILARAGSKGLPGKNVAPVAGRPCVRWTIDHAQRSVSVGDVVVSSDCERVRTIADSCGVGFVKRPEAFAGDDAAVDAAARHAASAFDSAGSHEHIVILYANVPVRPGDLTDRAVSLLVSSGCDSVQSYAPTGKHHPWWTARLDDGGTVEPWEGDVLNHGVHRRQDLPPAFIPDGGVIALRRAALMLDVDGAPDGPHGFFGVDRRGVRTNEGEVIDIDTRVDALVADAVLREKLRRHGEAA